jgi:hypothetical protein
MMTVDLGGVAAVVRVVPDIPRRETIFIAATLRVVPTVPPYCCRCSEEQCNRNQPHSQHPKPLRKYGGTSSTAAFALANPLLNTDCAVVQLPINLDAGDAGLLPRRVSGCEDGARASTRIAINKSQAAVASLGQGAPSRTLSTQCTALRSCSSGLSANSRPDLMLPSKGCQCNPSPAASASRARRASRGPQAHPLFFPIVFRCFQLPQGSLASRPGAPSGRVAADEVVVHRTSSRRSTICTAGRLASWLSAVKTFERENY